MTHTYSITGLTCNNCVAKAKSALLKLGDVTEADVQLASPQATITMQKHIPTDQLQAALSNAGAYTITEADGGMHHNTAATDSRTWWQTYKPVLLIGIYITVVTLLVEARNGAFVLESWMPNFMAAFFLVFSFFKMLDLKGFAESYSSYDIIAKQWAGWAYVYAFIEALLGLAFLLRLNPLYTNGATFVVMSISIIGVFQSVFNHRRIQCACLGAVFNLPMSTITIIEDALMIGMSAFMIATML